MNNMMTWTQRRTLDKYRKSQVIHCKCDRCSSCDMDYWGNSLLALLWVIAAGLLVIDVLLYLNVYFSNLPI